MQSQKIGLGLKLHLVNAGFQVEEVVKGGPCWNHLTEGDVLTHIQGAPIAGLTFQALTAHTMGRPGTDVLVKYRRGDQVIETKVNRRFTAVGSLEETIEDQIKQGMRRDDRETVESAFKKYAHGDPSNPASLFLSKETLLTALKEFDLSKDVSQDDIDRTNSIFQEIDRNGDKKIDFDEYLRAVQLPTTFDEWVRSMDVHRLISDAFPKKEGEDAFETCSNLDEETVRVVVSKASHHLQALLTREIARLRKSQEVSRTKKANMGIKFCSEVTKMECGNIDDFHKGVLGRTGSPYLDFLKAMEMEHCVGEVSSWNFDSPNYNVRTWPRQEWHLVTGEASLDEHQKANGRRIPDVDELLEMEVSKSAKLRREEVIAVVLYTSPMYYPYNVALRRWPKDVYEKLKSGGGRLFTTTIFVLVSALQKLCRVTLVEPGMRLFRGISEKVCLPDLFFKCDAHGCSGFTEWAFMSTTRSLTVALEYAEKDGYRGRVLVIEPGSVDRGVSVESFSQYPKELEVLFVPCSFVEQAGPRTVQVTEEQGVVEIIPVRVNANFKTRTVEEQLALKKEMHVTAFRFHIDQIEVELRDIASKKAVKDRLEQDPSADANHSIEGFVGRIVEQCKDVLSRHTAIPYEDYIRDRLYRNLVLEMIDVKGMARLKLKEWVENHGFIRFRWNSTLRSVHRKWTSHLRLKLNTLPVEDSARKEVALALCKALGMVAASVDEVNEMKETRLMSAAAEGMDARYLKLLVDAGAAVNEKREDGVTPIWLAAQNGHEHCITALVELKAEVNLASNNRATPVYIAARNGETACIRELQNQRADVNLVDVHRSHPIHQAALHGHVEAVRALLDLRVDPNVFDGEEMTPLDLAAKSQHKACEELLLEKGATGLRWNRQSKVQGAKRLIVSTGDISDVDGFFALAEYAKTGSDVLFIMNYPAYIGVSVEEDSGAEATDTDSAAVAEAKEAKPQRVDFEEANPGLGFRYSAARVLAKVPDSAPAAYIHFMEGYRKVGDANAQMKHALTDLAFSMAKGVWDEVTEPSKGRLMFGIGGINAINPFSETALKNEVLVYAGLVPIGPQVDPQQGVVYGSDGKLCEVKLGEYSHIYIDFNGSMAFWNGFLAAKLSEASVVDCIQGVFIMGGVRADQPPQTMPPVPKVLNRFSSATMNQLYHPQNTADFFAFLAQFRIPAWVVSNNAVSALDSFDEQKQPTFEGVDRFLQSNGLQGPFLRQLAEAHYLSIYKPPKKPFDYYCGKVLTTFLKLQLRQQEVDVFRKSAGDKTLPASFLRRGELRTFFYSNVYGISFISPFDSWEATRAAYAGAADLEPREDDPPAARAKKEYLRKELDLMKRIDFLSSLQVHDVVFDPLDEAREVRLLSW